MHISILHSPLNTSVLLTKNAFAIHANESSVEERELVSKGSLVFFFHALASPSGHGDLKADQLQAITILAGMETHGAR